MRQGNSDRRLRLIRCGCRNIEEVMKLRLMMEDLMEPWHGVDKIFDEMVRWVVSMDEEVGR